MKTILSLLALAALSTSPAFAGEGAACKKCCADKGKTCAECCKDEKGCKACCKEK